VWNPANDPFIAGRYSPLDLSEKAKDKADLVATFGIKNADTKLPVIGIVSRFAAQKGFDLISQIMDRLAREDMILTVLGTGDKDYEEMFLRLQKQFPQKIAVKVAYDNVIAHKIEAGADMFLMPSRYEPCGLNQIYSLKYGTVPIVRATGGLDDTIELFDLEHGTGTGFKFWDYTGGALLYTIRQALHHFADERIWKRIQLNGMEKDESWTEWCRPRHMLAPTVAEIANDYAGKIKVMKLNVDEAMNSAGRYNIKGIPTILVFKDGQVVEQIVGAVPKDQIAKAVDRHVG